MEGHKTTTPFFLLFTLYVILSNQGPLWWFDRNWYAGEEQQEH